MSEAAHFDGVAYARALATGPGVYRMLNAQGTALYVGKARNLKKRVASYFSATPKSLRITRMLAQTDHVEVTLTETEAEALLLENQLIKSLQPRYNVLLRDDKSYPLIAFDNSHAFPRIAFHRGARRRQYSYFGPFPSAKAVRESLDLLQKVFHLRGCNNSYFRNRVRPCLQYQIQRCSAPCVGLIGEAAYADDVEQAKLFLDGHTDQVIQRLIEHMDTAAASLDFERAARFRDQVSALKRIQQKQFVSLASGDLDVLACARLGSAVCVSVMMVRGGQSLGTRAHFLSAPDGTVTGDVLAAFISQHYVDTPAVAEIVVSHRVPQYGLLQIALGSTSGRRVKISHSVRGVRRRWVDITMQNANLALQASTSEAKRLQQQFAELQTVLGMERAIGHIEGFDIIHTRGVSTMASCVVFDTAGPVKSAYRRFNIHDVVAGDDYAAMHQVLERRYGCVTDDAMGLPELVLVDGGAGQVAQAMDVFAKLEAPGTLVVGISKGPERRPGEEKLILPGCSKPLCLAPDSPALHLLQSVRDESHRFAITGHRQGRQRLARESVLDGVEGVGPKRKALLLRSFGGLRGLRQASVEDLLRIPGIDKRLAKRIISGIE